MLYRGTHEVSEIFYGKKSIIQIYHGKTLVWEAAKSCYGRGFWDNNLGWNNDDIWKN